MSHQALQWSQTRSDPSGQRLDEIEHVSITNIVSHTIHSEEVEQNQKETTQGKLHVAAMANK